MAAANFAIQVNLTFPAGATQVGQYLTVQLVAPWGATDPCYSWVEALTQLGVPGKGGSPFSGKMGQYFQNGTLNNASGSGVTAFTTANALSATP